MCEIKATEKKTVKAIAALRDGQNPQRVSVVVIAGKELLSVGR